MQFSLFKKASSFVALVVLLLCFNSCATVKEYAGLGKSTDTVPFANELITGTLQNGLKYYIIENDAPKDMAFIALAVTAGSAQETGNERGFAHFVEHIVLSDSSAETGMETTVYRMQAPVETDAEGVKYIPENALLRVNNWTHNAEFYDSNVNQERSAILSEYRKQLDSPDARIAIKRGEFIFYGSPYSACVNVLGTEESIEGVSVSDLYRFYKKWYRPDNMALIISGDFDGALLEEQLNYIFNAPSGAKPFDRIRYELPLPEKNSMREESLIDPEFTETTIDLFYKQAPKAQSGTIADFRQSVINDLVSGIMSKRINQFVIENKNDITNITFRTLRIGRVSRFFVLSPTAASGRTQNAINILLKEKEMLVRSGFSLQEIEQEKEEYLTRISNTAAEQRKKDSAEWVDVCIENYFSNISIPDIRWRENAVKILLPEIKVPEVNKALRDLFVPNALSVFITTPQNETAD